MTESIEFQSVRPTEPSRYNIHLDLEWAPLNNASERDNNDLANLLKDIPLFRDLKRDYWRDLNLLFHSRRYDSGEVIFEAGMPGLGMYIITGGTVRIIDRTPGGDVEIALLQRGDFFGEMSLVEETVRSATAVAEGDTHLIGLFRPQLLELMHRRPRLGLIIMERLAAILARRLREASRRLSEMRHLVPSVEG